MVKFCKTCGSMMVPRKGADGVEFFCQKCAVSEVADKDIVLKQKIKQSERLETVVIGDQESDVGTESMYCPNCKETRMVAQWQVQTRSADEAPTTFFKCTTCQETWRDYGG